MDKHVYYSVEFFIETLTRNVIVGVTLPSDNHSVEQATQKAKEWFRSWIESANPVSIVNQSHALELKQFHEEYSK
jgi:hypothetical protein